MKSFQEYLAIVNDAIALIPYPSRPNQLYEPIAYHMALGGKRVRPVLALMACDAMGGDPSMALDAAVGLEMFHNFTLLHDDVMDNADVRRGKATVHRRWNDNTARPLLRFTRVSNGIWTMRTATMCRSRNTS